MNFLVAPGDGNYGGMMDEISRQIGIESPSFSSGGMLPSLFQLPFLTPNIGNPAFNSGNLAGRFSNLFPGGLMKPLGVFSDLL